MAKLLPVVALSLVLLGACGTPSSHSATAVTTAHPLGASDAPAPPSASTPDPPAAATDTLRGGPGVSPAELRRASKLLAATIAALPRWHTPAEAYAAGYRSIGDNKSVVEHYVNWSFVDDG